MEKLISVIVAIYNVDQYLEQCIESIINQSYKNLEIILVNDGATDNSKNICDYYSKIDKRVTVIHKHNGGVSSARNAGIDAATGDYIAFVDGDDYLELNMYETMINNLEQNQCNMGVCGYSIFYNDSTKAKKNYLDNTTMVMNSNMTLEKIFTTNYINGFLWNKIFSKKLFENIRLLEDMDICEDLYIVCKILSQEINTIYISQPLYNYRNNLNGATKNLDNLFLDNGKLKYMDAFERISEIFMNDSNILDLIRVKSVKTNIDTYYMMIKNKYINRKANKYIFSTLTKESIYYISHKSVSIKFKLALIVFNIRLFLQNWGRDAI